MEVEESFYQFGHKRVSPIIFEKWAYGCGDLEKKVGEELFLEIISTNYQNQNEIYILQKKIYDFCETHWFDYFWSLEQCERQIENFLNSIFDRISTKGNYFIIDKVNKDGWGPDIPEGHGFLLLASPPDDKRWGLYKVKVSPVITKSVFPISEMIEELIKYSEIFPPALAISRERMSEEKTVEDNKQKFLVQYTFYLLELLENQEQLPFFQATSKIDEFVYRETGEKLWIVGYHSNCLKWVSDDFHIYTDQVSEFTFSKSDLENLKQWQKLV